MSVQPLSTLGGLEPPGWVIEALADRSRCWRWSLLGPLPVLAAFGASASLGIASGMTFASALVLTLAAAAAVTDAFTGKIYNWLTYAGLLWGLGVNLAARVDPDSAGWLGAVGLESSLIGAGLTFAVMLLVHDLTGGGRGDIKLLTAFGSIVGWRHSLDLILLSYAAAGLAALAVGLRRYGFRTTARSFLKFWAGCLTWGRFGRSTAPRSGRFWPRRSGSGVRAGRDGAGCGQPRRPARCDRAVPVT
ncbi:MAG: A24 family peptidase [Isosphaeraceae bacterium]